MKAKQQVLVVDDDPNLRKTLADILKVKGYETALAANGAEAIAVAEREVFSLALIDLMLPDMPGLEVMARIKAISPLTEAIILTGHASMDTAINATGQGAFAYLLKPYQMDELLQKIRHAVERKQAQEEILRLASFPRLLPSPVIELDAAGAVAYLNPAAERLFPELRAMGQSHPLLHDGVGERIAALWQGKQPGETAHEAKVGEATYELHISYIQEIDLIRIYVLDITQRKQAEECLRELADHDGLTGLFSHRMHYLRLQQEFARSGRTGQPISLLLLDIDHFKRVNDRYGHLAGDLALKAISDLVASTCREMDIACRYGGEEITVILPETDVDAAMLAAERLRRVIEAHPFDFENDKNVQITVSIGVATSSEHLASASELTAAADHAMYRAKEKGRNRVERAEPHAD